MTPEDNTAAEAKPDFTPEQLAEAARVARLKAQDETLANESQGLTLADGLPVPFIMATKTVSLEEAKALFPEPSRTDEENKALFASAIEPSRSIDLETSPGLEKPPTSEPMAPYFAAQLAEPGTAPPEGHVAPEPLQLAPAPQASAPIDPSAGNAAAVTAFTPASAAKVPTDYPTDFNIRLREAVTRRVARLEHAQELPELPEIFVARPANDDETAFMVFRDTDGRTMQVVSAGSTYGLFKTPV
jgi:hypothetical protein